MSILNLFDKYNYYAKPDGYAPLDKVIGCGKYGALTGALIALNDSFLISKTTTMLDTLRCYGFWMVPLTGMATAFAATTYVATNLRGKDDPVNYVLGAIAAGGVLQAWQRCGLTTLYGTIVLSIFAAAKKDSKQSNWNFFGNIPVCKFKFPVLQTSTALEKKYERGWTRN